MTKYQESSISNSGYNGCGCLLLLMGIGVIGVMALPSPVGTARKARASEAKQYVSSMNRAHQALFIEKSAFATSVDALGLGIKTETKNYLYSVRATKQTSFHYGVSKQRQLESYVGGVFLVPVKKIESNAAKDGITTISILCEADSPGTIKPAEPIYKNGKIACGKGTRQVTR